MVPKGVQRLAALAANGKWPSNAERDMHRLVRRLFNDVELEPYYVRNAKSTATGAVKSYRHALILPHELFATYYDASPTIFRERFCVAHADGGEALKDTLDIWKFYVCYIAFLITVEGCR